MLGTEKKVLMKLLFLFVCKEKMQFFEDSLVSLFIGKVAAINKQLNLFFKTIKKCTLR